MEVLREINNETIRPILIWENPLFFHETQCWSKEVTGEIINETIKKMG